MDSKPFYSNFNEKQIEGRYELIHINRKAPPREIDAGLFIAIFFENKTLFSLCRFLISPYFILD